MRGYVRELEKGKWFVRPSCGVDPVTGRRLQPSKVVVGTRQDAERVMMELWLEHRAGPTTRFPTTLAELVSKYLAAPTRSGQCRSAGGRYREIRRFELHIPRALRDRPADSIKPSELTVIYDQLLVSGQSPTSVKRVHSLVCSAYSWGERRELVSQNPALRADAPSAPSKPIYSPPLKQVRAHLEVLDRRDGLLAAAFHLAAVLGLRRSELVALRWEHVDLDVGVVKVCEGVTVTPGVGREVTETKTGQLGAGILSLSEDLVDRLAAIRDSQMAAGGLQGERHADRCFVLSMDPRGVTMVHPDTLSSRLRRHCDEHPELVSIRLKDLRAFVATELEANGADITTAQAVLRHASPMTTMRHYRAAKFDRVRSETIEHGRRLTAIDSTGSVPDKNSTGRRESN